MKAFKFKDMEHGAFLIKDDREIICSFDDDDREIHLEIVGIGEYEIRFSSKRQAREEYERFLTVLGIETRIPPTDKEIEEEAKKEAGVGKENLSFSLSAEEAEKLVQNNPF